MTENPKSIDSISYVSEIEKQIKVVLQNAACQPILFVGSGLSRRYFGAPSWDELLKHLAADCPLIEKDFTYYRQAIGSLVDIGQEFARLYREWAWSDGKKNFPEMLFQDGVSSSAYIKYAIAQYLNKISPKNLAQIKESQHKNEISVLQAIKPHAIITTNYDPFLELVFPEYQPIIGQGILTGGSLAVGEIFKIHGCTSTPESLVLTRSDYDQFAKKKNI